MLAVHQLGLNIFNSPKCKSRTCFTCSECNVFSTKHLLYCGPYRYRPDFSTLQVLCAAFYHVGTNSAINWANMVGEPEIASRLHGPKPRVLLLNTIPRKLLDYHGTRRFHAILMVPPCGVEPLSQMALDLQSRDCSVNRLRRQCIKLLVHPNTIYNRLTKS